MREPLGGGAENGNPAKGVVNGEGRRCESCVLIADGSNNGIKVGAYEREEESEGSAREEVSAGVGLARVDSGTGTATEPPIWNRRNAAVAAASRGVISDSVMDGGRDPAVAFV